MIARLQQATTLGLALLVVIWGVFFAVRGPTILAPAGALLVAAGYAAFLGAEFAWAGLARDESSVASASSIDLARAWVVEVFTAPLVFCWRQPFRAGAIRDWDGLVPARGRPVLLVHGFLCNRGFWNPWMRRLSAEGVAFGAPSLEPAFGSIDAYAADIDRHVRRLHAASGQPVVVVAHSMGGLAVRAWLRQCPAGEDLVWRVITIASPHQGTEFARHAPSTNGQQMRVDSRWLTALAQAETPERNAKFTCYFGNCDNIVFPSRRAMLPGARHHHVPRTAHVRMASRPEIFAEVLRSTRLQSEIPIG